ncbi:MAG: hypothetical protein ACRC7O_09015, partial [Fimbriiglobus sp.]
MNKTGIPTSQLIEVYGLTDCFQIAFGAKEALLESITRQGYAHQPDVQAYLQQEIFAAYRFLREPEAQVLWNHFCTPELVSAVRTRKLGRLQQLRRDYREMVERITQSTPADRQKAPFNEPGKFMVTAALAWCYLVDSALLTDRMMQDMQEASTAKGLVLPNARTWLPYYLPEPPPDARAAFAEYVRIRWPIYVFALDPMTQDQNLADTLSTRRETQLALAVAFTQGAIGAKTLTKYGRRLEAEYEAIALNRTQVGFAHGENTFGWRFYPRFQTPDTESNLKVLVRDQLIGGPNRNQLLRQRRLEPGPRECVALVIMPSFVPAVTIDSVSNWFALANPKHLALDHTQAMRLSRTVKTLQNCEHAVTDADCYRDGELRRLQKRVEQLGNRLPTQTMTVPVPVLNTLGGFEMFSNGTTDLAPELYGFYGAPGVSADKETTLFLVGDHFSALRTRVIVGNKEIVSDAKTAKNKQHMLSRQVMQVTVPAGILPVLDPVDQRMKAQVHIATPYGVTRELLIPVIPAGGEEKPAKPTEGYTVGPDAVAVSYTMVPSPANPGAHDFLAVAGTRPGKLTVDWADNSGSVPATLGVQFVFNWNGKNITSPACQAVWVENKDNEFVVGAADLKRVAEELMRAVQLQNLKPGANPFDQPFRTVDVLVTPQGPAHAVRTVRATNQLTFTFVGELVPAACEPAVLDGTTGLPTSRIIPTGT